jgi:putative membrane protein
MMIGMGLFWLAIILGVVWLVRDGAGPRRQDPPTDNALTILGRRFAEGAISLDEYRQRRDVLTDAAAPHTDRHVTSVLSERS